MATEMQSIRIPRAFAIRMGEQQRATPAIVPVAVVPSSIKFVTPRITRVTGTTAISLDGVRMQGHQPLIASEKFPPVLDAE
jgi:hypothetical protein